MQLLDGKILSSKIKDEVKLGADAYHLTPILAVITIGDDEASKVYVENKRKACEYVGISMMHFDYVSFVKESVVIRKIKELNRDKTVSGIILQLPIPDGYDVMKIINTINPIKDVDGLTLASQGSKDGFVPCTPLGVLELLDYYKINMEGKHVVIVGRSNLVGKPLMLECLKRNATVTICHSKTDDLKKYTKMADILIVCAGKKYLIDESMVKKGVVVVDIGITREGRKIYGDVNPNVSEIASFMSPVPGGVGPMTCAMLMKNTLSAYKLLNDPK